MSSELVLADVRQALSRTENPYWDIVKAIPADAIDLKWPIPGRGWQPRSYALGMDLSAAERDELLRSETYRSRDVLVRQYAWAIPDPVTLDFVAGHSKGRIVEIGAGRGYWAWQLDQLGVRVEAYDHLPCDVEFNGYHQWHEGKGRYGEKAHDFGNETFFDVQQMDGLEAVRRHRDETLFLCWPPYRERMAYDVLCAFGGDRVIYIGEGEGGCTGDAHFHARLQSHWEEVASHEGVQWNAIHDYVTVYERREVPLEDVEVSEWCRFDTDPPTLDEIKEAADAAVTLMEQMAGTS